MTRASFYDVIKITHENTTEMKTRGKRDSDVLKLNDIITKTYHKQCVENNQQVFYTVHAATLHF